MNRALPPFPSVRAFEAAARHLSFKQAAEELHVTQSAVSHQVKALEAYLGRPLFRRTGRGVILTEAGQAYLPAIGDVLDRMAGATERLRAASPSGSLTVSTTPAFASRWLVPRLGGFCEAFPGVDVQIDASARAVDFNHEDIDLAVRFGRGDWPGLRADSLLNSTLFPVCSPKLLAGRWPLHAPDDLRRHTLLHDEFGGEWERWLGAAGVTGVDPSRGPRFSDCNLVMQAAIEGQGIALAYSIWVADDLAAGRLVKLFNVNLQPAAWYYVVCPEGWADRSKIAAFRDWLLAQAARDDRTVTTHAA